MATLHSLEIVLDWEGEGRYRRTRKARGVSPVPKAGRLKTQWQPEFSSSLETGKDQHSASGGQPFPYSVSHSAEPERSHSPHLYQGGPSAFLRGPVLIPSSPGTSSQVLWNNAGPMSGCKCIQLVIMVRGGTASKFQVLKLLDPET